MSPDRPPIRNDHAATRSSSRSWWVFALVLVVAIAGVIVENAIANNEPGTTRSTSLPLKLGLAVLAALGLSDRRGNRALKVAAACLILAILLYGLIRELVGTYGFQEGVNAGAL